MREYYYTIEDMIQFTAEYNKEKQIIAEYRETQDIDTIIEEDITSLFGDTHYTSKSNSGTEYYGGCLQYLSAYEYLLIDTDYEQNKCDFLEELMRPDYHFMPFFDTVQVGDFENDILWTWTSCTFVELLFQSLEEEGYWLYEECPLPI